MLGALDNGLLRILRTRFHQPPVERAVQAYTRLGEHGALWLAIAAAGAVFDGRRRAVYARAARATLIAYAANTLTKALVRRARPLLEDLPALSPTISPLSYPSAHASMAFAAAGVLREALPAGPVYVAAAAMALSRPYCGVHHPTDVVAGAALGAAVARLTETTA